MSLMPGLSRASSTTVRKRETLMTLLGNYSEKGRPFENQSVKEWVIIYVGHQLRIEIQGLNKFCNGRTDGSIGVSTTVINYFLFRVITSCLHGNCIHKLLVG